MNMPFLLLLLPFVGIAWAQDPGLPLECEPGEKAVIFVEAETSPGQFRKLRMVLDTGAKLCVVDPRVARGILGGLPKQGSATGFANRPRPVQLRTLKRLRVGSVVQQDVPVMVMNLAERNRWLDEPIDGLLGMSFLEGRCFLVDPGRAWFQWEGTHSPSCAFPLVRDNGYFYTSVQMGGEQVRALLDTGAGGGFIISHAPRGTLFSDACEIGSGTDGVVRIGKTRMDLRLFGDTFLQRPVLVGGGAGAIVGAAFLLAGPTRFDFHRDALSLPLDGDGRLLRSPLLPKETFFPILWNRKKADAFLEVAPLPACHRWYQAGFREGDRIVAVGELVPPLLNLTRINLALRDGQILAWKVQRGKEILALNNPSEDRWPDRLDLNARRQQPFDPRAEAH